jgi:hypothetical protein
MSNLILFGAGASFGAGEILPERPPLGNQLFAELARSFPGSWGSMPAELNRLFAANFERGMELLWKQFSPVVPGLMQHMAIYFVQFRPRQPGETLYCKLIRQIEAAHGRERVLLSTLNYECLLEQSVWSAGVPVNYGEFPDPGAITIWKLHGACNMFPDGIMATRAASFSSGATFGTGIRVAKDFNEVLEFCLGDNALPPVMCLFMPEKPVQASPSAIGALQAAWRARVMEAEKVAVVGVFPNLQDTHVWNALADAPGHLYYVGGEAPFREWVDQHRSGKPATFLGERFDAAFDRLTKLIVN